MYRNLIVNILILSISTFCLFSCADKKNKQKGIDIAETYGDETLTEYETSKKEFDNVFKTKDLALAEKWLAKKMENDTVYLLSNTQVVSILLQDLIELNTATMDYPFTLLKDNGFLNIVTSTDSNLKIYAWNDGTGNYNGGFHHIIQYKSKGKIYNISYESAYCLECEQDEDYDCRGFELYTMQLNDKTYYLVECSYMKAAGWLSNRDISIYTIEHNKLVKQTLFKTSKELLSEIGFEYDAASYYDDFVKGNEDSDSFDWVFGYDDRYKIIYIPLVDNLTVTDKNLLYQWDGKYFTYIGIEKGRRK